MKALSARTHLAYDDAPAEVTREVKAMVARGEMASFSFSLEAAATTTDLELFATPLVSSSGRASPVDIDLHVVHRWPQAGIGVFQSAPVEVGELLLKDDRVTLRDRYVRSCGNLHLHKSRSRYEGPDLRLKGPVRTSIAAGSSKQFWVSVSASRDALPGRYETSVVVRDEQQTLLELPLIIDVIDVVLMSPVQRTMMWYRGTINCHHPHHFVRTEIFKAQLADIFAHGFRDISLWETDAERLQSALDIAQSVGFSGDVVLDGFREKLWSSVNFGKLRPVAYVSDEVDAHPARYAEHADTMKRARANAVRTMASVLDWNTSGNVMTAESRPDVLSVYAPANSERLAASAMRPDAAGDVYFYWQAHMEKPLVHRLLAGLLLWKSGADGVSPYCYQHLPGVPNSPFDDFDLWDATAHSDADGRRFRDHMATYPARRGVIHTIQWKGLADGITDLKYLTTLQSAIDAAERSGDPSQRERGNAARKKISSLVERLPWNDLDILSETSVVPFAGFNAADMMSLRGEMVELLASLAGGVVA